VLTLYRTAKSIAENTPDMTVEKAFELIKIEEVK